MRLTYKETSCGFDFYKLKPDIGEDAKAQKWNHYDALNKLGQLEDVEDEYGIDLVTLFKAIEQGYVWVKENGLIEKNHGFCINETGIWSQVKLNPSDYGKTWALTKEELE